MMRKISFTLFMLTLMATMLTGCRESVYSPDYVKELKSQLPDFNMHSTVQATINYGSSAANAMIKVYDQNPIISVVDSKGGLLYDSIAGTPIFSTFLDSNGKFEGNFATESSIKNVWVVSSDWSTPFCLNATIANNKLVVDATALGTRSRIADRRRVVADNALTSTTYATGSFGTLTDITGGWGQYGKPNDVNQLLSTGIYTDASLITPVQQTFWHGYSSKDEASKANVLKNGDMVSGTSQVNTTIATVYTTSDGAIHTVQDCELWITFLYEHANYASTLGYYYYKNTDASTVQQADVEKFIVFPNTSISGNIGGSIDYSKTDYQSLAPVSMNEKAQLLFRDPETGKLTSKFPAGYTIGYFLISNAFSEGASGTDTWVSTDTSRVDGRNSDTQIYSEWSLFSGTKYYYVDDRNEKVYVSDFYDESGNHSDSYGKSGGIFGWGAKYYYYYDRTSWEKKTSGAASGSIKTSNQWIFSNAEWNDASNFGNGKQAQFVALTNSATGDVVYGLEDGGDQSYEDVLFTISATPNEAIYNPERPTIDESGQWSKTTSANTKHGYYAFEDIWSSGGDYDMNDVIVEYNYSDSITQVTNYTTTKDAQTGSIKDTKTTTHSFLNKLVINIKPRHVGATYMDGFSVQLPEYISTLYNAGKIKSIRLNNGEDLKDNTNYWKKLSDSNSDIDGNIIDVDAYQSRFTYEFFNDIRAEEEGNNYVMVVQFDTTAANSITPEQWAEYSHPTGATTNDNRLRWDYNPYITVYSLSVIGTGNSRGDIYLEIHMPLYPFTEGGVPTAGGASKNGTSADWNLWFVSAENAGKTGSLATASAFYPFAMDIPYCEEFLPSCEETKISTAYPKFLEWELGGSSDWYKYPNSDYVQDFTMKFSEGKKAK